jgi:FkbM family methyltransferase
MMIPALKAFLKKLPIPLSRNHRYDLLTKKIIQQHCTAGSNCIDVGAHRGAIMDMFLKVSPQGRHHAFEPIPGLYGFLKRKYSGYKNCSIHNIALSNRRQVVPFNHVVSNPAYSGLKKRKYDRKQEQDEIIEVQSDTLDNILPSGLPIHFIKIDVEGGEMHVLEGAVRTLSQSHPVIVFEFGIGGSDVYGTTPEKIYSFFDTRKYKVFLLEKFLNGREALNVEGLSDQFYNKRNYYFVAY